MIVICLRIAPCVGNTLLFDISGGSRELYAGDREAVDMVDRVGQIRFAWNMAVKKHQGIIIRKVRYIVVLVKESFLKEAE